MINNMCRLVTCLLLECHSHVPCYSDSLVGLQLQQVTVITMIGNSRQDHQSMLKGEEELKYRLMNAG
jgi:hypothetical protein